MPQSNFDFEHYDNLLETAFKNQNYEEAYKYATFIIENEPKAPAYIWADKGLCTGYLSTPEKPRIREMVDYLKRAIELNSDNGLNTDFIAIHSSYAVWALTKNILGIFSDFQEGFASANRIRTSPGMQKSVGESIGAGLGAGIANAMSESSEKKRAAKKLGPQFQSQYQSQILQGLEYAWSLDPSEGVSKNIFATFSLVINTASIDADTKRDFINNSAAQLISNVKEKYPERSLPEIQNDGCLCFIATAVMGDHDHPYVITLRQLRDQRLQKTWAGQRFIDFYYRFSPPVARIIAKHDFLRVLFYHILIKPAVKYANFVLGQKKEIAFQQGASS